MRKIKLEKRNMKIALIGYGKMGKMIEEITISRGHEITTIIDLNNQEDFESKEFASADVAIEFTTPNTAYNNCMKCFDKNIKVVSGTTGWLQEHSSEIKQQCERGKTLFWSSNFSVGVAIFSAVNRYLAKIMNNFQQYNVTLQETHHIHKLDAPSGTAITLAQEIIDTIDRKQTWTKGRQQMADGTIIENNKIKENQIPIESIREGEVAGIHSISYDSDADEITITHNAHSRKGFALGAVLAAEYTMRHQGLLSMQQLFHF